MAVMTLTFTGPFYLLWTVLIVAACRLAMRVGAPCERRRRSLYGPRTPPSHRLCHLRLGHCRQSAVRDPARDLRPRQAQRRGTGRSGLAWRQGRMVRAPVGTGLLPCDFRGRDTLSRHRTPHARHAGRPGSGAVLPIVLRGVRQKLAAAGHPASSANCLRSTRSGTRQ